MIYQIYYNPEQKEHLLSECVHYYNIDKHPSLESYVIKSLKLLGDPCGVLSWKIKTKLKLKYNSATEFKNALEDNDVISFFSIFQQRSMVKFMSQNLKFDFGKALEVLLKGTGYEKHIYQDTKFVVYQNAFVCRKAVFVEYQSFLNEVYNNIYPVYKDLLQPSGYHGDKSFIEAVNKREGTNLTSYPVMPFCFELLFSIFLNGHNFKCKHVR